MAFTFFFRDRETLEAVAREVLPRLRNRLYLHVWDAGCATGPEPYSLAIVLREHLGEFLFRNLRLHATDLDGSFGPIVSQGIYRRQEVARLPADVLARYFTPAPQADHFVVAEEVRRAVSFTQHDLTSLRPIRSDLSLILCKNVLLHLPPRQVVDVLRMFHAALTEEGYLVTEQTQELPAEAREWFRQITPDAHIFARLPAAAGSERELRAEPVRA